MASADLASFTHVDPGVGELLGTPVHALTGPADVLARVVPEDRERAGDLVQRAAEETWTREYRVRRPDGTTRWVCDRGSAVRDAHGVVDRYVGFLEDVTDRRARELELRESEAEMRALLGAMTDLIFVIDRDGRHLKVGPTSPELLYRPAQFVLGRTLHELFDAALAHDALGAVRNALDARQSTSIDYELEIRGERRWFSATVSPLDADRVLWVARDVTEHARADRERANAYHAVATLVEQSPLAIVALDTARRVTMWNRAAEEMFGYTRDEVLGGPVDVVPKDRLDERAFVERALSGVGAMVVNYETQRRRKDGTFVDVLMSTASFMTATGERNAMAFFADMTERRHLEEQLRQSQKMDAVGRLAGGIAHDFNNLLTVVINHGELLLDELPAGSPWRDDVQEIHAVALRAAALTRQLLAFSRRQLLQPRTVDVGEIVRSTEAMLRRVIGEDVQLDVSVPHVPSLVRADAGQLEQVMLNLAVNARDAMPNGGTLSFVVRDAGGDHVALDVRDTGVGMTDAVRARAFEPFFTTKEPGRGTGLGLATVYAIARQSGGFVGLESAPGRGTTVSVHLPRSTSDADPATTTSISATSRGGTETILVVEDEDAVRAIAVRVLGGRGYRVLEARTGREALDVLARASGPVDLVLSDYVMPEMGGPELAARLAARAGAPPVVFMSGYTGDALRSAADEPGARPMLEKPFSVEQLLATVRAALDGAPPP